MDHRIEDAALAAAFKHMHDAWCHSTQRASRPTLSAVAALIAGSGAYGGAEQTRVADIAEKAGFRVEFYTAGTIRVTG